MLYLESEARKQPRDCVTKGPGMPTYAMLIFSYSVLRPIVTVSHVARVW
jgi:hypothetical protein